MTAIVNQEVETASRTGKGVKINGEWYNSKFPVFLDVSKGTVVSFEYTEGASGGKFVKGEVSVDQSSAPPKKKGKPSSSSDYGVGAAAGMAINNAVTLCLAEKGTYEEAYVKRKAVEIYQLAEEFKSRAMAGEFDIKREEEVVEEAPTSDPVTESPAPF